MNTNSLDLESGSAQYASILDAAQTGLDLSGDFTIECWVKLESQPATNGIMILIGKNDGNAQRAYNFVYQDVATVNKIQIGISQDGGATNRDRVSINYTLTPGTWTHIAVTCDISQAVASEFEFFINGVSQGNGDVIQDGSVTAIFNSTATFGIGDDFTSGGANANYFDGKIDDVRVWNTIRTGSQISSFKSQELVGNESGLVGYWKFNGDYLDETSNNNDLTASGSPVFSTDVPFTTTPGNFFSLF